MFLEICICTHAPRPDILSQVIQSLAAQTVPDFGVLIVDSGSPRPVTDNVLRPLLERGISARIVREDQPGVTRARLRGIAETDSEWMLYVDDDNVLLHDYVEEGLAYIQAHQEIGCFGGRCMLPPHIDYPRWVKPFLPYLAIRDEGDLDKSGLSELWCDWEPPGAGAFVCRAVLNRFAEVVQRSPVALSLGRSPGVLYSCDDSLMMRGAFHLGKSCAYNPRLALYHHLDPSRLKFSYLLALFKGYGASHVLLELILRDVRKPPPHLSSWRHLLSSLRGEFRRHLGATSWQFASAMCFYHYASFRAFRSLGKNLPLENA